MTRPENGTLPSGMTSPDRKASESDGCCRTANRLLEGLPPELKASKDRWGRALYEEVRAGPGE